MKVSDTDIPDVKIIEPSVFGDNRGFFMEAWNEKAFSDNNLPSMIQRASLPLGNGTSPRAAIFSCRYKGTPSRYFDTIASGITCGLAWLAGMG